MLGAVRFRRFAWIASVPALLMTATCSRPSPEASYASGLQAARAAKDDAFKTSTDSPIPPGRRAARLPLAYFAPDQDYIASASLAPAGPDERPTVEMPTSTGKMRTMQRVGRLEFVLKGQSLALGAFIEAGSPDTDRLFVPFTDLTSGTETYPAGRYLDLLRTPTGIYLIDFNRAYHPYCYYNPAYDCPYPPPENRLTIPIRAGERMARAK